MELFSRDIPTLPTHLKRVDHISAFIGIEEVHDYPKYCQVVISDCWRHSVECAVHAYLVQNAKLCNDALADMVALVIIANILING